MLDKMMTEKSVFRDFGLDKGALFMFLEISDLIRVHSLCNSKTAIWFSVEVFML